MERPALPLEFALSGTPVSLSSSPKSKAAWQQIVGDAAAAFVPDEGWLLEEPLGVTIWYFPKARMQGDIDNIIKPILDGMKRRLYTDDRSVERVLVQRFDPGAPLPNPSSSDALFDAIADEGPAVFIRIEADPFEEFR